MTEDAKLDEALGRVDETLAASLRRDEARRQKTRRAMAVAAVVFSFGLGAAVGALIVMMRDAQEKKETAAVAATRGVVVAYDIPTTGPCEVKWGAMWRKATIVDREGSYFLVKWDGYTDFFNEWVTPERIRAVGSTATEKVPVRRSRPPLPTTTQSPETSPAGIEIKPAGGSLRV